MSYPVTLDLNKEPRFPDYSLETNPFHGVDIYETGEVDQLSSFWACAAIREATRIWWKIVANATSEEPAGLWLLRDENSVGSSNIATVAAILRRLSMQEEAHFLPLYVPLPLATDDVLKAILRTLADRIVPTDLRKCFYAFAADKVASALGNPAEREELSAFEDISELASQLEDPRGSGIHAFLFPTAKQQAEERHVVKKPLELDVDEEDEDEGEEAEEKPAADSEETAPKQSVEELSAERERILERWEKRDQLTRFLERRLHDGDFGAGVPAAIRKAFETSAFMQARDPLTAPENHRETLGGLLRFLRYRYSMVIPVVDQVEAFGALTETEKASFYGALAEFEVIAGSNAVWLFASFPATLDVIGKRRLAAFDMITLELAITREVAGAPVPPKIFVKLVEQFLATDPLRAKSTPKQKKADAIFPFDAKSVEKVLALEDGDSVRAVRRLSMLLEEAQATGRAKIDVKFVDAEAEKWAAEAAAKEQAEAEAKEQAEAEASAEPEPAGGAPDA